ncbi:MAG TPA: tyrosine-type recombinase/integrase [Bryobacteraceae bacterium]|jgi:integrase
MRLYNDAGQRKYLTPEERSRFLCAAKESARDVRVFCEILAHTGCRVSEALALTGGRIDLGAGVIVIESLKKRRKGLFRAVPVPPALLKLIEGAYDLAAMRETRLVKWSRSTAWRRTKSVLAAAGIEGAFASPKGLRHGFAICAVASEIPLNLVRRWMGHSSLEITSIYADAVGSIERRIAERMWRGADAADTPREGIAFRAPAYWRPVFTGFQEVRDYEQTRFAAWK